MHTETKAVHTGVYKDGTYNSVTTPIYPSSTFYFDAIGKHRGFDYTRSGNPTRAGLEENLADLEGGVGASITCTGMSAVTTLMFLFQPGDHIITGNDIYGGTYRSFASVFKQMGIQFSFVDMRDPANIKAAVRENTKAIWIETPSNPLLNITDIRAAAKIAHDCGAIAIADNTFLSPYFQRPLELGCDIVMHSTTKYINGHSDVVGGAIISKSSEWAEKVKYYTNALGTPCSPFDAWLVLRGVKTLVPRMKMHETNAIALAEFLDQHPKVKKVYYPGLKSFPQYDLVKSQMHGFGGMLSFDVDTDLVNLDTLFEHLQLFILAESLGGVESLIEQPWSMSHASMDEEARVTAGITPGTIRVSVGLEHPDDLIADMENALDAS